MRPPCEYKEACKCLNKQSDLWDENNVMREWWDIEEQVWKSKNVMGSGVNRGQLNLSCVRKKSQSQSVCLGRLHSRISVDGWKKVRFANRRNLSCRVVDSTAFSILPMFFNLEVSCRGEKFWNTLSKEGYDSVHIFFYITQNLRWCGLEIFSIILTSVIL